MATMVHNNKKVLTTPLETYVIYYTIMEFMQNINIELPSSKYTTVTIYDGLNKLIGEFNMNGDIPSSDENIFVCPVSGNQIGEFVNVYEIRFTSIYKNMAVCYIALELNFIEMLENASDLVNCHFRFEFN